MKGIKKIHALALAMVMAFGLTATNVFANEPTPSTPSITIHADSSADEAQKDTTSYTWYRIFEADIQEAPQQTDATQTGGKVAYYVNSAEKVTEINKTNLFNVTRVGTANKWYVELKDSSTSAEAIATAFAAMDLTEFASGTFAQTVVGGTANSGPVDPGYYYITSTAGSKVVIQTLGPVTINEKNEYVTDNKTIPDADKNSQIGQEITYTLTVNVPVTANDQIVLTDTMSKGLTFKEVKSQSPIEGAVSPVTAAANDATKFTITYTADQIKGLVANKTATQTITVEVTVTVNNQAVVDTGIPNTLDLKYGNNYEATPKTVVTKTTKFDFDKVDGSDSQVKLTGAEFKLTKDASADKDSANGWIDLVEVEAGKTYRIATSADTETVDKIVTNGNTVTVNGLDLDDTYYLVETKAPTGYNILNDHIEVKASGETTKVFAHQNVANNKGAVLPSTGGIGTTIFYAIGSVLVVGAGVLLISKKRMFN